MPPVERSPATREGNSTTVEALLVRPGRPTGSTNPVAARLTPKGRGAVATICLLAPPDFFQQLPPNLFLAANGQSLCDQKMNQIAFGHWGSSTGEEVVVCRIDSQTIEIHCHGGEASTTAILGDLEQAGCELVDWREVDQRRLEPLLAECRVALTAAPTLRTANLILDQMAGGLATAFQTIDEQLAAGNRGAAQKTINQLLEWSKFGLKLTQPWRVAILGRPNVGKSSLLNALAGFQRAIVFDEPGTTRDVVTAEIAIEGWPVTLVDTAGIRQTNSPLEASGIELAQQEATNADLRLIVLDASQPPTAEDLALLQRWPDALIVVNKIDLPDNVEVAFPEAACRVSTKTGEGIDELGERIAKALIPAVPPPGTPIPVTIEQVNRLQTLAATLTKPPVTSAASPIA